MSNGLISKENGRFRKSTIGCQETALPLTQTWGADLGGPSPWGTGFAVLSLATTAVAGPFRFWAVKEMILHYRFEERLLIVDTFGV